MVSPLQGTITPMKGTRTVSDNEGGVPLAGLDWEQLGRSLAMLAPIAVQLRHASVESTLRDYIHPEPLSESDFIRDLFMMPLDEVVVKWYGSHENASRLAAVVMDQVLDGLMPGGMAAFFDRAGDAGLSEEAKRLSRFQEADRCGGQDPDASRAAGQDRGRAGVLVPRQPRPEGPGGVP